MPAGVRLEWRHPSEKDYGHTEVRTRASGASADEVWTVRGSYFERRFETAAQLPEAQAYRVRHLDRSGNASADAEVTVTPLAVEDLRGVMRDTAYLAQAAGGSTPTLPADVDGNSDWTRKPTAPTAALPVVWRSCREAELDGEDNPTWSAWSAPEPFAVHDDSTVAGFSTQVELEFRSLDRCGRTVGAVSSTLVEPTYEAPLVQARRRFRASSADSFPDWDPADHTWRTAGRLTAAGARYGVLAELGAAYAQAERERTIYSRSDSDVAPSNPTGTDAVPAGWSATELAATAAAPYIYRLTARTANGLWPDWSAVAAPTRNDTWAAPPPPPVVENVIYRLAASAPAAPTGTAFPPADWSAMPLEATGAESVWRTSRSVTEGLLGTWSEPENWEPWLLATFYQVNDSSSAPSAEPVAASGRQDSMVAPAGWQTEPVYPASRDAEYRWVLQFEGPARNPSVVPGFPTSDIRYHYEIFGVLHTSTEEPPDLPTTFGSPEEYVLISDGGLSQQVTAELPALYLVFRFGYSGGTDAADVTYPGVADWSSNASPSRTYTPPE